MLAKVWTQPVFTPISVKVSSKTVHMLQLTVGQGQITGFTSASAPISGSEEDRDRQLSRAISSCLEDGDFKGRQAALCLGDDDVLIQHQRVTLENGEESGELEALKLKISEDLLDNMPGDMQDPCTRFVPVGRIYERNEYRDEVISMIVDRHVIDGYLKIFNALNIIIERIDVEPFSIHKAFVELGPSAWTTKGATGVVNMGESKSEILIIRDGHVAFVRTIPVGMDRLTQSIASRMNVDKDGMSRILGAMCEGRKVDGIVQDAVRATVRSDLELLCSEILTCFRYFASQGEQQPVERVVFLGGIASQLIEKKFLEERLGLSVFFWKQDLMERSAEMPEYADTPDVSIDDDYVSLAGLALSMVEENDSAVDFLPPEVSARRALKKTNKFRAVYLMLALFMMGTFYFKNEERLTVLEGINNRYMGRSNLIQMNSKEVDRLVQITSDFKVETDNLSETICPILPTRVLAEIVNAGNVGISLGRISASFSFKLRDATIGKRTQQVLDISRPIYYLNVEGFASSSDELSTYVSGLRNSNAFASVRDEGFWDVEVRGETLKQFNLKLVVGE